jgi:polyphosphate kinase
MKLTGSINGHEQLRFKKFDPHYSSEFDEEGIMSTIAQRDVLLYHPYESFEPVNEFVWEAAKDPDVLAIKMTMYRVSGQSSLVKALEYAAAAGKQVTVIVELKARFDEENNIAWAKRLENAGCHVVYGLVGLKIHAKMLLVVRREKQGLKRYVHVGTGNYNENTAKLYTDIGLMTSNDIIGADTSALFNEITGYSSPRDWEAFAVAPTGMKKRLLELIEREIAHAVNGKQAKIVVKINSLSNQEMIDKLYEASAAGVSIQLIVRGVCCLRPGVTGISENIQVISIVDRYLEHSRIAYFYNDGQEELYLSSADWMTRNLEKRVELMCPVFDSTLKESLIHILNLSLADNEKARILRMNGQYEYYELNDETPFRSQFAAQNVRNWKNKTIE